MLVDFVFDEQVAKVFPDMIRRSVPGYDALLPMLGLFASRFVTDNTNVYDLGCSLGAATLVMRRHIQQSGCQIIAVDNAPAMVQQCRENLQTAESSVGVQVLCQDILDLPMQNASLVVVNFTLQFLPLARRDEFIQRIYSALNPGGVLLLSEKIKMATGAEDDWQNERHLDFKRANGYSEMEISQKRTALENVLIPESEQAHHQRLQQAGFTSIHRWFQCFNFSAFFARRS